MQFTKWSLKKSVIFCLVSTKLKQISEKSEFKFVRDRSKLKSWVLEYESGSELSNQPLEPAWEKPENGKIIYKRM